MKKNGPINTGKKWLKMSILNLIKQDHFGPKYSAVVVYVALALGIIVLALPRMNINANTTLQSRINNSLLYGGIFGLTAYATFDFTMHFMFDKWNLSVSIMDSLWGGILCALVTFIISYL